jgi:hypothetical protein
MHPQNGQRTGDEGSGSMTLIVVVSLIGKKGALFILSDGMVDEREELSDVVLFLI